MGVIDEAADSVLLAAATIPEGKVTTYGAIGRMVGYGPRVVARVMATRGQSLRGVLSLGRRSMWLCVCSSSGRLNRA